MNEMEPSAAPRVTPAIAALKDNVAAEYRALIAALPGTAAHAHWHESHGALCIVAVPALIRLSEEVGKVLAHANDTALDAAQLAPVVSNAGAAILGYMDHLAAGFPDQPARLLPAYRALLQARGIEHVSESDFFCSSTGSETAPPGSDAVSHTPAIPESLAKDLKRFNDAWAAWAAGQAQADALRTEIDAVERASAALRRDAVAELLAEICSAMRAQAAAGTPDPDTVVEISCALLMLEDLIEDAPRAGASFARRAANARARLQACQGDRDALQSLPAMELLDAQARRDEVKVVTSHTLAQADSAIGYAVSVLEAFFEDDQTRGALGLLDKPLAQCAGMFAMLQDEAAAAAIGACRTEIGQLASATHDEAPIRDRLARRLTALAEYVRGSPQDRADLDALLARAGLAATPALEAPKPVTPTQKAEAAVVVAPDAAEALDSDMLEVFLEEAVEVLSAVKSVLPASRNDPGNAEHLTSLRRAFHTLKGSGRMVGLTDLGEAAWEIEQVFNKLAQDGLPATPDLYRLVDLAHENFARWVSALRSNGNTTVDSTVLADWARRLRAGEALPAQLADVSEAAPTTLTPQLDTTPLTIGATMVSPVLYGIFIDEARQHIAALERYGRRLASDPRIAADPEFQRAAHTLCGISGTVGFEALSELASSLERILLRAEKTPDALDPAARGDVMRAIDRLARMVARVGERQTPEPEQALIDALDKTATTARVVSVPATPDAPPVPSAMGAPAIERARVTGERRITRLDDDIDPELLAVFLTEAQELLPHIGRDLHEWREHPQDKLTPQSLQRLLHTLKGSGRMAGAMAVGELTHRMETRVENASRLAAVPESLFDELDASFDRLNVLIDELQRLECDPGSVSQNLAAVSDPLSQTLTPASPTGGLQPLAPITLTQPVHAFSTQPTAPSVAVSGQLPAVTETKIAAAQPTSAAQRAVLRVRAESAERLANQAGEVAIARARAESELRGARGVMRELTDNIMRLRGQLREIEVQAEMQMQSRFAHADEANPQFDPLEFDRFTRLQELTRLMAESVNDLSTVQQNLMRNLDEGEAALGAQARTTREMQDDLVRIRMAPFSSLSDRLYRVARLASRDVGKRVQLDIRGGHAELDRGVLDRIIAPLEHLLRNSIAHGIEPEPARKATDKAEVGEIVIEVRQQGNEVVLGISDDGAGLDIARIRAQAVAKGLMREDDTLSDAQIADFIFRSGFSTAESVSEIAGRGVGMDVVRNEIASLGGRIEMYFERGKGTRFTIYLSLTLAVLKAVVIRVGDELYAVPSLIVEQIQSLKPDALAAAYSARELLWHESRYVLHYLAHLLGRTHTAVSQQRYNSVLLLRSGPHRAAIHVDQLLGGQEIVVKNIGPQLARVPGVTGAAVLAGGETVLILNPVQLAQRADAAPARGPARAAASTSAAATAAAAAPAAARTSEPAAPRSAAPRVRPATVLVVDDSLTVRKITSRALTREGYDVVLAKDGIEALEKMQARAPDVIVTDIEMPRMDGFDLTRNVRSDPRLKDLPVIMITSRTADKHRTHAAELGVTVFLGKPYEERELLRNIAGVVRVAA